MLSKNNFVNFITFLKPILNEGGFSFKEPQISEEKRLDIAITFYQHQYVVELKVWRGKKAHEEGLNQLANYLEKQNLKTGYLVIFDQRVKKSWNKEWIKVGNKRFLLFGFNYWRNKISPAIVIYLLYFFPTFISDNS